MTSNKRTSLPLLGATALLAFFTAHCSDDGGSNNGTGGQTASGGQSASGGSTSASGGTSNGSGGASSGGASNGSGGLSSALTDVNGCTPAMAEDHSGASADRKVLVGATGLTFTPKCMAIKAGQSVSFEGTLAGHPLAPGNPNSETVGSPNNPIMKTSSGTSVSFTFAAAGVYPYYCQFHASGNGEGMAGVIYVLP